MIAGLALALVGCGGTSPDESSDPEPGDTLRVSPALARLEVVNGASAQQTFTVTLVKASGREFDVTARALWTADDEAIGTFDGALFTAVGNSAGLSPIHALVASSTNRDDTITGDAMVEVFVRGGRVGPGAPPNAPDLFGTSTPDPGVSPDLVYPPDGVIVPQNLGDMELHWRDTHGHDLFELSLVNDHVDLRVYVGGTGTTGFGNFTGTEWYAAAHGGRTITVGVRALTVASPGTVGVSATRAVKLSDTDLLGGLYYWAARSATGSAYGIFRHDFSEPGMPAQAFFTTTEAGRCVACHALSRDGTKMAVGYDGGDQSSTIVDVASQTPAFPPATQYWNFPTYTPDGTKLITSRTGVLSIRDGSTGTITGTVPVVGYASHPDFAATGTAMAYAHVTGSTGQDWHFTGGNIATISYDPANNTWGTPVDVVIGGGNNYYPSFSPDGKWILFNRSTEDAYDDASAELWFAHADGSGARKLDLANVGAGLTNSWARWAPFRATYSADGQSEDMYWITFSSKRDFGVRLVGTGRPQLWMSPFFPGRAEAGMDPSAPAFRLPMQDINTDNHIAQWTETVVPIGRMQTTQVGPLRHDPPAPGAAQR